MLSNLGQIASKLLDNIWEWMRFLGVLGKLRRIARELLDNIWEWMRCLMALGKLRRIVRELLDNIWEWMRCLGACFGQGRGCREGWGCRAGASPAPTFWVALVMGGPLCVGLWVFIIVPKTRAYCGNVIVTPHFWWYGF
jgi:hypothetical protein